MRVSRIGCCARHRSDQVRLERWILEHYRPSITIQTQLGRYRISGRHLTHAWLARHSKPSEKTTSGKLATALALTAKV